jgi:hypothetical protein
VVPTTTAIATSSSSSLLPAASASAMEVNKAEGKRHRPSLRSVCLWTAVSVRLVWSERRGGRPATPLMRCDVMERMALQEHCYVGNVAAVA